LTRTCAFLVAFAASACISHGSHLSATPTAPGQTEYSFNVDALLLDRGFGPQILPNPEASIRWRLARELDFGLRVNALGGEASSRLGVVAVDGYRLTAVPLLGGGFVPATNQDTELVTTTLGLVALNGVKLASRTELVIGLRAQPRLGLNAVAVREDFAEATWSFVSGGSLGVRFPLNARLFLFPEAVVVVPYDLEGAAFRSPILQAGIGLQWGAGAAGAQSSPP
jgi:hypothetical protein